MMGRYLFPLILTCSLYAGAAESAKSNARTSESNTAALTAYQAADLSLREKQAEFDRTFRTNQVHLETANHQDQLDMEKLKFFGTMGSVFASIIAAGVGFIGIRRNQRDQAREAFTLKAAEIVMAGRSWDVKKRAEALRALFPHRLAPHFAATMDPEKHGWGRDSHNEL